MRIHFDCHVRCDGDRLMYGAAMGNFQQSVSVLRRERLRQTNRQGNLPYPMRPLSHRPFGIHLESIPRNSMTRAISAHKVSDATRERADKEFHRTHPGVGTSILDRLIRNDGMRTRYNIEPGPAMMRNGQIHRHEVQQVFPRDAKPLLIVRFSFTPSSSIRSISGLFSLWPVITFSGKVSARL